MPNLQQADEYFANHLLKERLFEFSDAQRSAAVAGATLDVTAALKLEEFPAEPAALIVSAVFEQAIYLLLNPHIVASGTDADKQDIISPRAQAMLFDRSTVSSGTVPDEGGDSSGSGSDPGTADKLPVQLSLCRG